MFIKEKFTINLISVSKDKEISKTEGFVFIQHNRLETVYYPADKTFIKIKTNKTENFNGRCYRKIIFLRL